MSEKHLHLSKEHRIIAGVCGGLAEYFESDPVLIRLIFIFFSFVGGSGILLYLVLWALLGGKNEFKEVAKEMQDKHDRHHEHTRGVIGFFLIIIGVLILMNNLFPAFNVRIFWPLVIIFFGLAIMLHKHHGHDHH